MPIIIELCKPEEIEEVMNVNKEAIPETYERDFWLKNLLAFPEGFFVAKDNSKIIGYIMDKIENIRIDSYTNALVGHVVSVAVLKEYRGQGIGNKLLLAGMNAMIEKECNAIQLQVRVNNVPAITLYKKYGFQITQTLPHYYLDDTSGYLMIKGIKKPIRSAIFK